MKRTSFVCFGAQGSRDSLVYQEIPGRDGGEEFFLFFSPGEARQEPLLRNLFREAVSASRLGAPTHYYAQVIEHVKALMEGAGDDEKLLSGALFMIQIRRGDEVHLLCNRESELVHWDAAKGRVRPADSIEGISEVPLGARDQRDLFKRDPVDLFVLYRFTMPKGEHTIILVPSKEFIEQHSESLRNSIFFPSFAFPQETGIEIAVARSFPALHWSEVEREEVVANERRAFPGRRLPVPVAAGVLAGVIAIFIFSGPLVRHGGRQGGTRSAGFLAASDKVRGDSVRSAPTGESAAERPRTGRPALSEAWKKKFSAPVTSSPVVREGTIYLGCRDGFLYAYKPDGELLWKYGSGAGIGASPCYVADRVVCANYRGDIFCLNAKTGQEIWTLPTRSKIVSTPTAREDLVVVGTMDGRLIALRLGDAQKLWEKKLGSSIWANPAVGKEYVIAATTDGSLVKLDLEGKILWRAICGSGIRSSPTCLEDRGLVVVGTKDKGVHAYSLATGAPAWRYTGCAEVSGSPRCDSHTIYVGTKNGNFLALGFDGRLLWRRNVGGAIYSKPLLIGETLIVATQSSRLVALEAESGAVLGEFRATSAIYSSPDHDDEQIYFGSYGGFLYAVRFSSKAAT